MTHEEIPTGPSYDLPISVVAEYELPPPPTASDKKPIMSQGITKFSDQNYRTPEYHKLVSELIEFHRPKVKINTIMPCRICDNSWYLRTMEPDEPEARACRYWREALKVGLIKRDEHVRFYFDPETSMSTSTTVTTVIVPNKFM